MLLSKYEKQNKRLVKTVSFHKHSWASVLIFTLVFGLTACKAEKTSFEYQTFPAAFSARAGVEQITVTKAAPGQPLTLISPKGKPMVTLIADERGQAHFAYVPRIHQTYTTGRDGTINGVFEGEEETIATAITEPVFWGGSLEPGKGYLIRDESSYPWEQTGPITVLGKSDVAEPEFYSDQVLHEGLNYIIMRDGVKLSATVWFPDQTLGVVKAPYPTVITYSGYSPSNPDSKPPGALIATMLGFAAVGVNIRGTGCSGGVFDIFNPAQHADGYDIVEVVAAQEWVKFGKVGMVGLSYPGITQLYTASTAPPHLAAIMPQSVVEDPWRQQWPGGVYNIGFTRQWLAGRDRDAMPGGQSWVRKLIDGGDLTCAENQNLRYQNMDFELAGRKLTTYHVNANERRLSRLIPNINVPVFLSGGWQDEQTGSRFATMLDDFTNAPVTKFTMYNGKHPDGYTPLILSRWYEFIMFYVARKVPELTDSIRKLTPTLMQEMFGTDELTFEDDRFTTYDTYEKALAAYEAEPKVRILFENGAGGTPPLPIQRFETSLSDWPPPDAREVVFYLDDNEQLSDAPPVAESSYSYQHDPDAGDVSWLVHDGLINVETDWQPVRGEFAVTFTSEPLADDLVLLGNGGYLNVWFATEQPEANIEVSLIELSSDGIEYLVQSGVFDARWRDDIDEDFSSEFLIEYTYKAENRKPLEPGVFYEMKIPIRPFGHAFRAGSRLRLVIDTPGRDSAFWEYQNPNYDQLPVHHSILSSPEQPSYVVFPAVDGIEVAPGYPPCPSLRGIVCREADE